MNSLPVPICMIAGNQAHRIRRSPDIIAINDDAVGGTNQIAAAWARNYFVNCGKAKWRKKFRARQRLAQTGHINETLTCLRTPCKAGRH